MNINEVYKFYSMIAGFRFNEISFGLTGLGTSSEIGAFVSHTNNLLIPNKFGFEMFVAPDTQGMANVLILMYKGECVFYINKLPYQNTSSKITNEFLEINYRSTDYKDILFYNVGEVQEEKMKSFVLDIDSDEDDVYFQSSIWMDLPEFDIVKNAYITYKNTYTLAKKHETNIIFTNTYLNLDYSSIQIEPKWISILEQLQSQPQTAEDVCAPYKPCTLI